MYSIGHVLKLLRKCTIMTQKQLSTELQCHQNYLSRIENDLTEVPVSLLDRYELIFGVSASSLLEFRKLSSEKSIVNELQKCIDWDKIDILMFDRE